MGYKVFRTSRLWHRFSHYQRQTLCQHLIPIHLMIISYARILCQQQPLAMLLWRINVQTRKFAVQSGGREVLCAAKDESSVDIMRKMFSCNFLQFLAKKSNMTIPANTAIDARCDYFEWAIVGFRGVRPDPIWAPDYSKLTCFGCFGQNDEASDWIADRLANGPTGIAACGSTILPWCRHRVGTVIIP
jgi:hypothetical protein